MYISIEINNPLRDCSRGVLIPNSDVIIEIQKEHITLSSKMMEYTWEDFEEPVLSTSDPKTRKASDDLNDLGVILGEVFGLGYRRSSNQVFVEIPESIEVQFKISAGYMILGQNQDCKNGIFKDSFFWTNVKNLRQKIDAKNEQE